MKGGWWGRRQQEDGRQAGRQAGRGASERVSAAQWSGRK
jgi:hypothetical protein